jgi:hypothetical protein
MIKSCFHLPIVFTPVPAGDDRLSVPEIERIPTPAPRASEKLPGLPGFSQASKPQKQIVISFGKGSSLKHFWDGPERIASKNRRQA